MSADRPNRHPLHDVKEAATMVVVGADVHKRTHTFVAIDDVGRKLGHKTVKASSVGHLEAIMWAREQFGTELLWGIEDCRAMSARLERDLLSAGQKVVRVPTKMMKAVRDSARTRGKSDPIDATAVARAVLREPDLPVASHDEVSRELKLLTDRRETLVAQRTATINTLRWRIHELDPEHDAGRLDRPKHQQALWAFLDIHSGLVAELAGEELFDIIALTDKITTLEKRISAQVSKVGANLLLLYGCAELTAAKIIGETADVTRFRSEAAFANHAGVGPIPVWSGNTAGKMRLNRSGNRQLNAALYRIAITQIRQPGHGQSYYLAKRADGKTKKEAIRCLKRYIARDVYHRLHADQNARSQSRRPAAA
jgi:transposase